MKSDGLDLCIDPNIRKGHVFELKPPVKGSWVVPLWRPVELAVSAAMAWLQWFSILRWISHLRPLCAPIRRERGFSEPIQMRFWPWKNVQWGGFLNLSQTNMEGFSIPKRDEYRLYGKDPQPMWMRHWLDDGRLAAMISWELTYVSSLWIRLLWLGAPVAHYV